MEFHIKRLRQLLTIVLALGLTFCLFSCSSDEFEENPASDLEAKSAITKNADGTESLILKIGQSILLDDTVTYVLDFGKNAEENLLQEKEGNLTRAVYYTGFDRKYIEKKNKKYLLKGLENMELIQILFILENSIRITRICQQKMVIPFFHRIKNTLLNQSLAWDSIRHPL